MVLKIMAEIRFVKVEIFCAPLIILLIEYMAINSQ